MNKTAFNPFTGELDLYDAEASGNASQALRKAEEALEFSRNLNKYLEDPGLAVYGIQIDAKNSSPDVIRVGNLTLHATLPVQSRMRVCLLDDDGNVTRYINNDESLIRIINSEHPQEQIMVEIPEHYRSIEVTDNITTALISEIWLEGFEHVPKAYISAFEATLDSSGRLASVLEGCTGGSYGTYGPQLPVTGFSRSLLRDLARRRKAGSCEWNIMTYEMQKTLFWLFTIEYATLNCQIPFSTEVTSEGFRLGGLGPGMTDADPSAWKNYNGQNPIIMVGEASSRSRAGSTLVYNKRIPINSNNSVSCPVYRGIEHPFGHISKVLDGVRGVYHPDTGLIETYICEDPESYGLNDTSKERVIDLNTSSGFISALFRDEIFPAAAIGSSATYFCDAFQFSKPASKQDLEFLWGGNAASSLGAGLLMCEAVPSQTSAAYNYIGTRLCFIPSN